MHGRRAANAIGSARKVRVALVVDRSLPKASHSECPGQGVRAARWRNWLSDPPATLNRCSSPDRDVQRESGQRGAAFPGRSNEHARHTCRPVIAGKVVPNDVEWLISSHQPSVGAYSLAGVVCLHPTCAAMTVTMLTKRADGAASDSHRTARNSLSSSIELRDRVAR